MSSASNGEIEMFTDEEWTQPKKNQTKEFGKRIIEILQKNINKSQKKEIQNIILGSEDSQSSNIKTTQIINPQKNLITWNS